MQPVFLDFEEALPAAVTAVVHLSAVQRICMFYSLYVQGFKIIELQSHHLWIDLPIEKSYSILNQGLVFWFTYHCRKDNTTVMVCKCSKVIIDYRLNPSGLYYDRLEIVGNYKDILSSAMVQPHNK